MGLRAGLDWCGKSGPTGIRSRDRPARGQSLYRLRYPAHMDSIVQSVKSGQSKIGIQKEDNNKVEIENAKHVMIGDAVTK